jgi:DNA-binding transcriptional regulator YdaS (Cro superfamily)
MTDDEAGGRQLTPGAAGLKRFLQRNGVTQVAAALALGVSDPTVYDWVSGKKRPRTHHREAISLWTNGEVSADEWLEEHERAAVAGIRPYVAAADDESGGLPAAFDVPVPSTA